MFPSQVVLDTDQMFSKNPHFYLGMDMVFVASFPGSLPLYIHTHTYDIFELVNMACWFTYHA